MSNDILFTPEEIANRLKITKNTVYEMIKRGDIHAHRIGKHLRISESQYEIFILESKGAENIYEASIVEENNNILATVGLVSFHVNTELRGACKVSIRPEDIILSKGEFVSSARNMHKGNVTNIIVDGQSSKVVLDIGIPIVALITKRSLDEMKIEIGSELYVVFKTMSITVYR